MLEKYKIFRDAELPNGRMMSYSKSSYREANPHSITYFNANIITITDGKVWFGDLDLTKDAEALKRVAAELGETLFVLKELDCRFDNEDIDHSELIKKAVWDTTQETPFK
jgi:hypothetical protein